MRHTGRILSVGGSVTMLLDQRAQVKPVLAPFFGRIACCDRSVGVLVRRTKAPILLTACYMTDEPLRYRIEVFGVIRPEEVAGAGPDEIAARINQGLERMILARPEQYFWLHDRFRDSAEAERLLAAGELS